MKELTDLSLDTAKLAGASYADIRIIITNYEYVSAKNEKIADINRSDDEGFGVRVIADGAWGFASSSKVTKSEIERVSAQAVKIAKASALLKKSNVILADEPPHIDTWKTPYLKDPFIVPLETKIDLLLKINNELMKVKDIKVARSHMRFIREHQFFASTDGSFIEQELLRSAVGYTATAVGEGDMQVRSYPDSHGWHSMSKGYEFVEELPLLENTQRVAEEASALIKAPKCPEMKTDLIISGSQLSLQIHESVGHPTELDRVLGTEANYAGTSFVTPEKLGSFKYGSPIVNIVADSTIPYGLATIGYDDEGVSAQRWHLIENGIFVGYLTSRETAPVIGEKRSRGAMRADGWHNIPLIRMTNISLMPGEWTLDDLIADTKNGVFVDTNRSWSIDQKRLNFQFGTEIAWEIKNGKKTRILKNPVYQGITPEFWNSCDAICNGDHFVLWGVTNCGKGQPGQTAEMSHGSAPARFRNVQML
ncbi:TPA: TldD/PmbA family protein [Candidatus Poribacteria bacterium]|nr:TldD/PmbA family protein [Candidatus Poribacteria bacterium]